jgi:predicted nuclease of predicted toxin-antitoxin system
VVSKDTDFRQLAFLYGPPPKVVWLRVGNVSTSMIEALLLSSAERVARFVDDDEEALLVVSRADQS